MGLFMGLLMRCSSESPRKKSGGARLQPLVHHKTLSVYVLVRLGSRCEQPAIEIGNHISDLLNAKGDETVPQFGPGSALFRIRKFQASQNRTGVDSLVHGMDGDADWNVAEK